MRSILITDTHLTAKPTDEYRFDVFRQVSEVAKKQKADRVTFLGDLLDSKDNHSGTLVNKVVDGLVSWVKEIGPVQILRGNHDGLSDVPYLDFVNHIPGVELISKVKEERWGDSKIIFLPHTRSRTEWDDIDFTGKIVFAHVTVNKCITETGFLMENLDLTDVEIFEKAVRVYSGDIHKPQNIGNFSYVGCPYNVRFADGFDGRILLIDTDLLDSEKRPQEASFYLSFPRKICIDTTSSADFEKEIRRVQLTLTGEANYLQIQRVPPMLKVRLHLTNETLGDWREEQKLIKDLCLLYKFDLMLFELVRDFNKEEFIENKETSNKSITFKTFCKENNIDGELVEVGEEVIKEVFGESALLNPSLLPGV